MKNIKTLAKVWLGELIMGLTFIVVCLIMDSDMDMELYMILTAWTMATAAVTYVGYVVAKTIKNDVTEIHKWMEERRNRKVERA